MVHEGLITPDAKGLIDFDAALLAIAENQDPGKGGKQTPVEGTFYEHRTRKEAALARLREIEASEKEGILVNVEDLRRDIAKLFVDIKARLRAIPSKTAGEVYHTALSAKGEKEGKAAIFKKLQVEIDEALLELSQWKPSKTVKGVVDEKHKIH